MAKIIEKARPAGIPVLRWRNTGIKVTSARQASLVQDYSSIRIFTWPAIFPFRKPVQVAYGVVAYTHLLRSLMERTLLVRLQNCWYLLPLSNLMVQFLSYLPLVPRTNYCQLFELRILYLPKKGTKQICRGGSVAERLETPCTLNIKLDLFSVVLSSNTRPRSFLQVGILNHVMFHLKQFFIIYEKPHQGRG